MGTRSTTKFIEKQGNNERVICAIYKQYDGYLEGYGKELAEFVQAGELVNGIPGGKRKRYFNGIGDLAAQWISEVKDGSGGVYLINPDNAGTEEYNYEVLAVYKDNSMFLSPKELFIRCFNNEKLIFEGSPEKFLEQLDTLANEDENNIDLL